MIELDFGSRHLSEALDSLRECRPRAVEECLVIVTEWSVAFEYTRFELSGDLSERYHAKHAGVTFERVKRPHDLAGFGAFDGCVNEPLRFVEEFEETRSIAENMSKNDTEFLLFCVLLCLRYTFGYIGNDQKQFLELSIFFDWNVL